MAQINLLRSEKSPKSSRKSDKGNGIAERFRELLNEQEVSEISIVSAWMTPNPIWEEIKKAKKLKKIKLRLLIGIDSTGTNPKILKEAQKYKDVELRTPTKKEGEGLFHPKMYIFHLKNGEDRIFVGSANFTKEGMGSNTEILLEYQGINEEFINYFEERWNNAHPPKDEEIEELIKRRSKRKEIKGILSQTIYDKEAKTWNQFYKNVEEALKERRDYDYLGALKEYPDIIRKGTKITEDDAIKIRGIRGAYQFLGDMRRVPVDLTGRTKDQTPIIEILRDFLDEKILRKEDRKRIALEYFERLCARNGIKGAMASRLLTITRPDLAVSYNKGSAGVLNSLIGKEGNTAKDDYYELVLDWLNKQDWFNTPEPTEPREREIWLRRGAFLDFFTAKYFRGSIPSYLDLFDNEEDE